MLLEEPAVAGKNARVAEHRSRRENVASEAPPRPPRADGSSGRVVRFCFFFVHSGAVVASDGGVGTASRRVFASRASRRPFSTSPFPSPKLVSRDVRAGRSIETSSAPAASTSTRRRWSRSGRRDDAQDLRHGGVRDRVPVGTPGVLALAESDEPPRVDVCLEDVVSRSLTSTALVTRRRAVRRVVRLRPARRPMRRLGETSGSRVGRGIRRARRGRFGTLGGGPDVDDDLAEVRRHVPARAARAGVCVGGVSAAGSQKRRSTRKRNAPFSSVSDTSGERSPNLTWHAL